MLILLDITPDQTMVNEGIAREVVNRIQRLRKKVKMLFIWSFMRNLKETMLG